jgi:hypothetical protein
MSGDRIYVPLRTHNNEKWGALDSWKNNYVEVVAYEVRKLDDQFPFLGGHRMRLYKLSHNPHFKLPAQYIEFTNIAPSEAPPAAPRPVRITRHGRKNRQR